MRRAMIYCGEAAQGTQRRRQLHVRGMHWILLAALATPTPGMAGPPFVTDDPEPVEYGHWEINNALVGTLVQGGGSAALPWIDANYGLLPDVQLHVQPQLDYVRTEAGTEFGIGDRYRDRREIQIDQGGRTGPDPDGQHLPTLRDPTGNHDRGLGDGVVRTFLPIWAEKGLR
jgi:hypothetical protein